MKDINAKQRLICVSIDLSFVKAKLLIITTPLKYLTVGFRIYDIVKV